jgi:hypothetical protein
MEPVMQTPNLSLPLVAAGQSQKHVTVNESLVTLDRLVQLAVESRTLTAPPGLPSAGSCYIVGPSPTGAWTGHAGEIASSSDGVWHFTPARTGWLCWLKDEGRHVVFSGGVWVNPPVGSLQNIPSLGVNTTADTSVRLQVKSPTSLFDAETPSGGHRLTLNKGQEAATASAVFQSGYTGRGEIGLMGDNHLRFKVSDDGAQWREALVVDSRNGRVSLPLGPALARPNLLINGEFRINQRNFAGGALTAGAFGHDRWRAFGATSVTVSGGIVTLSSGAIEQVVERALWAQTEGFQNAAVTLSWLPVAGAALAPTVAGLSAAPVQQLDGRMAMTVTLGAGVTGNITVRLSAAGPASFSALMLERGPNASSHQPRNLQDEARLCQRYYWERDAHVIGSNLTYDVYTGDTNTYDPLIIGFPTEMRVAPTASLTGTFTPTNVYSGDQPLQVVSTPTQALLRARGAAVGRRYVICSQDARLAFSAEL